MDCKARFGAGVFVDYQYKRFRMLMALEMSLGRRGYRFSRSHDPDAAHCLRERSWLTSEIRGAGIDACVTPGFSLIIRKTHVNCVRDRRLWAYLR